MTQHDYDIADASGAVFRADLNNCLDAIATNNSGATPPTVTFANMWWLDTSTGILRQRNNANTAWLDVADKSSGQWVVFTAGAKLDNPIEFSNIVGEVRRAIADDARQPV